MTTNTNLLLSQLIKEFEIGEHLIKLHPRRLTVHMDTVPMKDEELATDLKYNGQRLLLAVITLILTWLKQLSNWCRLILTC